MASLRSIGGRAADFGRSLVDTFLRDNRLLPPILALLTLFVFAWVLAGVFVGGSDDQKPVSHRAEFAQADDAAGSDPAAPEVDNPNVDSYAAYRSKDPFRRVLVYVRTTPEGTPATTPEEATTAGGGNGGRPAGRPAGGGRGRGADTDGDGLPDRKEVIEGLDPNNPDTDGDGTPDGLDDADGDGLPDGVKGGPSADGGRNGPGGNGGGTGGRPGQRGDLLDSGGTLAPPP